MTQTGIEQTAEVKTFWKLECDGSGSYIDTADGMAELVRIYLSTGDDYTYTISPIQMTQAEFDALPESDGGF